MTVSCETFYGFVISVQHNHWSPNPDDPRRVALIALNLKVKGPDTFLYSENITKGTFSG